MNRSQFKETPQIQERLSPEDWIAQTRPLLTKLARLIDKTIDCVGHFIKSGIYYFEDINDKAKAYIPLVFISFNTLVELHKDLQNLHASCNQFARAVRIDSLSASPTVCES